MGGDTGTKVRSLHVQGGLPAGGGVYLAAGESAANLTEFRLSVSASDKVGLYNNIAEKGGDDVVADANNTYVVLPQVENMELSKAEGLAVGWFEDYFVNDPNYAQGTQSQTLPGVAPNRYREYLGPRGQAALISSAQLAREEIRKAYLCMSLGFKFYTDMKIVRTGLHPRESALYRVYFLRKTIDESDQPVTEPVLVYTLINVPGDPGYTILKDMEVGEYRVEEVTDWTWAGHPLSPVSVDMAIISDPYMTWEEIIAFNTVTFESEQKVDVPKHAEARKENVFSN